MKVIIVGAGRTGRALIEDLLERNYNDITVVETDEALLDSITDRYNVNGVLGSGASRVTLQEAGAELADVLIAVASMDEINLLCCMQAKSVGTKMAAARVLQQDFLTERMMLQEESWVDYIFNPHYDMAEVAFRSIGFPGIVKPEGVFSDGVQAVMITVNADSGICGKRISELKDLIGMKLIIGAVLRADVLYIPTGRFTLEAGDQICITAKRDDILELLKKMGATINPAKRIMILGGGFTAEFLLEMIVGGKRSITVIEKDIKRCRYLMEVFPSVSVAYGEGESEDVLENEHIKDQDVVLSLTDVDEVNLVASLYAWTKNVPSVLTRIERPAQLALLHKINLDITLSSVEVSVNNLIRFVHNAEVEGVGYDVDNYCSIADNKADVFQFTITDAFSKNEAAMKDPFSRLIPSVLITGLIRNGEFLTPGVDISLQTGDKIFVTAVRKRNIQGLNDIFV